jgi:hypothetical protein
MRELVDVAFVVALTVAPWFVGLPQRQARFSRCLTGQLKPNKIVNASFGAIVIYLINNLY